MRDEKIKTASGKPAIALIPLRALVGVARVFAYGAKKYAPGNYKKAERNPETILRYLSALHRHGSDLQNPDGTYTLDSIAALDPESGLYHLDHMLAGLIMLRSILDLPDPGVGNEPPSSSVHIS
jgi:hypothetical protein